MSRRELRETVTAFRKGILNGRDSDQMCFAVCAALQGWLRFLGVETELVEGDFGRTDHYWLALPDGRIIDPTADQFTTPAGEKMPKVYIGDRPLWYRLA